MENNKLFVAVVEDFATRDCQVCFGTQYGAGDDWRDWPSGEMYLDLYRGSYESALAEAVADSGLPAENIRLIEIPMSK